MDDKGKITQESKDFIVGVIKLYKKKAPEEIEINITVGNSRTVSYDSGNKVINVRVLSEKEADILTKMKESVRLDALKQAEIEREKAASRLSPETIEAIRYFSEGYKTEEKVQSNNKNNKFKNIKRNLKKGYKKLKNKTYKLAGKTIEKVEEAGEFLKVNGKKVVSSIAIVALLAGVSAHTISTAVEGHNTFEEYGSLTRIENRMNSIIRNEYRKALNNNNIETELDVIEPEEEGETRVKVTLTDPNDPNFEMTFMLNDFAEIGDPMYMNKIARKYITVNDAGDWGKVGEIAAGVALNKAEDVASKNDIIVKDGAITGKPNMDRVPERSHISDGNER